MNVTLTKPQRTMPRTTVFSPVDDALDLRQLRHQTKNALQHIIAQIAGSDLRRTAKGRSLVEEVERRVCLTARVSDALFGLREVPGPLPNRLAALAEDVVALLANAEQTIQTKVVTVGACPPALHQTVVRIAHEMVANAVKHGMHLRLVGHIEVQVCAAADGRTMLSVADDGWGFDGHQAGEGMPIMRQLAARHGGQIELLRRNRWTVARLDLPAPLAP